MGTGEERQWRITLEEILSGEVLGFPSLEALLASNAFGSSQVSGVFVVEEEMMEVYIYLPLIPRLADE